MRVSVGDDGGSCIVCVLGLLEPASLLYTVYFETLPFGCNGGSHETNMLSAVSASALMPAGGPGTARRESFICTKLLNISFLRYPIQCLTIFLRHAENRRAQRSVTRARVSQHFDRVIRVFVQRVQVRIRAYCPFHLADSRYVHCDRKDKLNLLSSKRFARQSGNSLLSVGTGL